MPTSRSSSRPDPASRRLLALAAFAMAPGLALASVTEDVLRFSGVAHAEDGSIAYVEEHEVHFDEGRPRWSMTEYRRPDGEPFANLESEYGVLPYLPAYHFRDERFGREAGIVLEGEDATGFGRRNADADMAAWPITPDASLVAGQGLNYYLRDHLEELAAGDSARTVEFFMPLRGQTVRFRVERLEVRAAAPGELTLTVAPESWWLRILTQGLEVTYDAETRRIIRYRGPSNILDDGRRSQDVDIVYRYPEDNTIEQ